MTDLRQAAQQAVEALEKYSGALTHFNERIDHGPAITALRTALKQQAEPVAWMDREGDLYKMPEIENWAPPHTMLYTASPQRQWVGLTDKEIIRAANALVFTNLNAQMQYIAFAQVIETKLKEKNSD